MPAQTMMMPEGELSRPPHYTAYLVRLWQESAHAPWRASAQSASSGEKMMFATLEDLFTFLRDQTILAQEDEETRHHTFLDSHEERGDQENAGA